MRGACRRSFALTSERWRQGGRFCWSLARRGMKIGERDDFYPQKKREKKSTTHWSAPAVDGSILKYCTSITCYQINTFYIRGPVRHDFRTDLAPPWHFGTSRLQF